MNEKLERLDDLNDKVYEADYALSQALEQLTELEVTIDQFELSQKVNHLLNQAQDMVGAARFGVLGLVRSEMDKGEGQ